MSMYRDDTNVGERPLPVRILAPFDGSELAAKALPMAEYLCRQLSAELHLVAVVPYLVLPYGGGATYISGDVYQQIEEDREQEARQYLEQAATSARDHGIQVQTHLTRGDAAARLLDIASELHVRLIVMTTHGRTGLSRFTLGSVADRVVRGGAAPVLLLRSFTPSPQGELTLSRALVPLDGSPQSEAPLYSLVPLLAGSVVNSITLVRVCDPRNGPAGEKLCGGYLDEVRQKLVAHLAGCDCAINQVVLGSDSPARGIVGLAEEGEYHLVLMATHGEAGVGRWTFGGVTDRVLRDGTTPLLLVHPPRA